MCNVIELLFEGGAAPPQKIEGGHLPPLSPLVRRRCRQLNLSSIVFALSWFIVINIVLNQFDVIIRKIQVIGFLESNCDVCLTVTFVNIHLQHPARNPVF